ncbi:MAG: ParB/RepB/Spo0J family partition protein [Alphaproteobacteria bacterium]|nr:ParB/RepB/Spo0J family partition protein [Alphaproteobacteria bacterium]
MVKVRYKELSPEYAALAAPVQDKKIRSSLGFEGRVGEFYYMTLDLLIPYENQARKSFSETELNELANTIREHGIRQPLSIVRSSKHDGKFEVVSGERRLRAAKMVGLEKVPCIIIDSSDTLDEVALIENIQRSDLHPVELSSAYYSLLEGSHRGDLTRLGEKLGVTKSHISEILKLYKLPEEIKEYLLMKNIRARATLRMLCKLDSLEKMKELLGLIKRTLPKEGKRKILQVNVEAGHVTIDLDKKQISESEKLLLIDELTLLLETLKKGSS